MREVSLWLDEPYEPRAPLHEDLAADGGTREDAWLYEPPSRVG